MTTQSTIVIRKATVNDASSIASCLLLAMKDIVYKFIGSKEQREANAFMQHFVQSANNQYSYRNCWVAIVNENVVGAINVYNGAQLHALRQPVLQYLQSRYGHNLIPEDETGPGEYYIDSFGVIAEHQGKGIGAKMLRFVIDAYVAERGQTLGLLVDKDNPGAKRLYRKLGFESVGEKMLLGKQMEHLQINRLQIFYTILK